MPTAAVISGPRISSCYICKCEIARMQVRMCLVIRRRDGIRNYHEKRRRGPLDVVGGKADACTEREGSSKCPRVWRSTLVILQRSSQRLGLDRPVVHDRRSDSPWGPGFSCHRGLSHPGLAPSGLIDADSNPGDDDAEGFVEVGVRRSNHRTRPSSC